MNPYTDFYKNKKVGFVGAGISNLPILELFLENGIEVSLRDRKSADKIPNYDALLSKGVSFHLEEGYLDGIYEDILFLSPALRPDIPEISEAREKGVVITTELEEFLKYCPCKTVGITGSDGKTTTSTITAKLLEASGKKVFLGGNIGENLFVKLGEISKDDFAVIEISSFQLMKMSHAPNIAIVTNVSPNHLDWHKGMEEYIFAKSKIVSPSGDRNVLNLDDETSSSFKNQNTVFFGKNQNSNFRFDETGIWVEGKLILRDEDILLPGIHNRANYSAAIAAVYPYITEEAINSVAKTFGGVEHRIELVRVLDGVTYYNSSIDTSPTRTAAALKSFKSKLIVIAGGYDKQIPLEPLADLFENHAKAVVLMGATAEKIDNILKNSNYSGTILYADNMEEAVEKAKSVAVSGDKVILSPAAASFDKYPNFGTRGNHFKSIVNGL